jgi:excisionase family DNA binding protein
VEEDYYTTGEAARVLRVSESRIRQMLGAEELEGSRDLNGRWRIPQRAVHERMERVPREPRVRDSGAPSADVNALIDRLAQLEHQLGRAEAVAELTEEAHSTTQEALQRERERADKLEAELRDERSKGFWARLFGG